MKVDGVHFRSIWASQDDETVEIIDQRWLPHEFRIARLSSREEAAVAIRDMWVRGAPLIGATAAYGMALQMREDPSDGSIKESWARLHDTRPTAINLRWALDDMVQLLQPLSLGARAEAAWRRAADICDADVETNRKIGLNGLDLIRKIAAEKNGGTVNILTHCNAGWLATVDWGTATSPIFQAAVSGIDVHVWVDETRPRNQGALTAWEMAGQGVPHTYIVDNAGGHLIQRGQVDMVLTGTDRTTATGDVCNKIGTYLKALAARAHDVPFFVALPSTTIDWRTRDGIAEIPIEERPADEVEQVWGTDAQGGIAQVRVTPPGTPAGNPAFDVTPAALVTGLITERGVADASAQGLSALFPEQAAGGDP